MKRNADMLHGPIFKGILRFAIPVVLTPLFHMVIAKKIKALKTQVQGGTV